jgi:peptidoglycan/LPS O-acetylase OafA/YrhL
MPLSEHEQRMLDQIESALYAEDPKFASSVRGGTLRAPSARRRFYGAVLFILGLALLVSGVPLKDAVVGGFPVLSVIGFIVMFAGVVFAVTGPRAIAKGVPAAEAGPARARRAKGSGGSFTSRMEERFRRRFDE